MGIITSSEDKERFLPSRFKDIPVKTYDIPENVQGVEFNKDNVKSIIDEIYNRLSGDDRSTINNFNTIIEYIRNVYTYIPGICVEGEEVVYPMNGTQYKCGDFSEVFNDYRPRTYRESDGITWSGNVAAGRFCHVEGECNTALQYACHVEGGSNVVKKHYGHAEGFKTTVDGVYGHAEGYLTQATGNSTHAEGSKTVASGNFSHAEGSGSKSSASYSHAEGFNTTASGSASHAEGNNSKSTYDSAHSEGYYCEATGYYSHAEGNKTKSQGNGSHSEGYNTIAYMEASHAEGTQTKANSTCGHAEGSYTEVTGSNAHAENAHNKANGLNSHAQGYACEANGERSHVGGFYSQANGINSFAHGNWVHADASHQAVFGQCNVYSESSADRLIVGNGVANDALSNALRVADDGVYSSGNFNAPGADYAEYFEWADGNPDGEDRVGRFVTLDGDMIKLAKWNSTIIGIVSANPSVIGDVYDDTWNEMYLKDIYGRYLTEEVDVPDVIVDEEDPNTGEMIQVIAEPAHKEIRRILNPDYDSSKPYIPRSKRKEWSAVGMLGKLVMLDDGSSKVNGYVRSEDNGIATSSEEPTKFVVLKRLDSNHIKVLILS